MNYIIIRGYKYVLITTKRGCFEKTFEIVHNNPLVQLEAMLNCIQARVENYKRGGIVLFSGNPVKAVGIVLVGSVHILKEDQAGKSHILAEACASELFGETFVCMGIKQSPVTVKASEKSEILFINYRKIITVCSSACAFHIKLIRKYASFIGKEKHSSLSKARHTFNANNKRAITCVF